MAKIEDKNFIIINKDTKAKQNKVSKKIKERKKERKKEEKTTQDKNTTRQEKTPTRTAPGRVQEGGPKLFLLSFQLHLQSLARYLHSVHMLDRRHRRPRIIVAHKPWRFCCCCRCCEEEKEVFLGNLPKHLLCLVTLSMNTLALTITPKGEKPSRRFTSEKKFGRW